MSQKAVDPTKLENDVAVFKQALFVYEEKNTALVEKQVEQAEVLQELAVLSNEQQTASGALSAAIDAVQDDYESFRPVVNP